MRPTPLVCAHRGASLDRPDNSFEAFEAALAIGADMIETDVRMAADGSLVLAHDEADVLPGAVRLEALLELARGRIGLDLEVAEPGYEREVLAALGDRPGPLMISSVHVGSLAEFARLDRTLLTGYVFENFYEGDPLSIGVDCGATAILVEHDVITDDLIRRANLAQRALWAWTVNDEPRLEQLFDTEGLAGVITDDPALALRVRDAVTSRW